MREGEERQRETVGSSWGVCVVGGIASAYYPAYWHDGKLTRLTDDTEFGLTYGLCVSEGDLYVTGNTHSANESQPLARKAVCWKNGKAVVLGEDPTNASAKLVAVAKNGVPSTIAASGYCRSLFVKGDDVYVSGYVNTNAPCGLLEEWSGN